MAKISFSDMDDPNDFWGELNDKYKVDKYEQLLLETVLENEIKKTARNKAVIEQRLKNDSISDTNPTGYTYQPITLEHIDEAKFKEVLKGIYEKSNQDSKEKKACNYYPHCFSIGGTALFSLITTLEYRGIINSDGEITKAIVLVVGVILVVLGIIFLSLSGQNKDFLKKRDEAVDEAYKALIKQMLPVEKK